MQAIVVSRVTIACVNGTGGGHAAVEWAAHEASRRDLPLKVPYGSPPNDLSTSDFAFDAAHVRGLRLYAVHAWELPSAAGLRFHIPGPARARK